MCMGYYESMRGWECFECPKLHDAVITCGWDRNPGNAWLREANEAGDWKVAAAAAAAAQGSGLKAPKAGPRPPKAERGKSWRPNLAASIFSCRLHLALLFWNQTWKLIKLGSISSAY